MTDLAQFTTIGTVHVALPRYAVSAVVGNRIYTSPDWFIDVDQSHDEILKRLQWKGSE